MTPSCDRISWLLLATAGALLILPGCSGSDQAGSGGGSGAASVTVAGSANGGAGANGGAVNASGGAPASGGASQGGGSGADPAAAGAGGALPVAMFDDSLRQRAQASMVPLASWYTTSTGLWNKTDWWTSANQLETVIDYTRETGDSKYSDEIDNTFVKNSAHNFDQFGFYDDDGWWALTWIKAYDLSHQQKYLDMAKTIFKRMSGGWDDKCGGGIYWASAKAGSDGLKNKNAIPNSLFLTVAARLHLRTPGDTGPGSFLDWAQREWTWFKGTGMLTTDHQVVDSLDSLTACKTTGPVFTYNNGSLIAGLTDLAASTGDSSELAEANAIAHATMTKMANKNGILVEAGCGGETCVQFKGVFLRALAYLYRTSPLPEYRAYMRLQSDNLWNNDKNAQDEFPYQWQGPLGSTEKPTASRQSSALDALIAAVRSSNMNLALVGATATGGTPCSPLETASNTIDGSARWDSKWCTAGASGQVLSVDLGAARSIVGFRVQHAGAGGDNTAWDTRDFEIQTSSDGQSWAPAVVVTGNTSDITTHGVPPINARYARLHITTAQTSTDTPSARIYELEIFGTTL